MAKIELAHPAQNIDGFGAACRRGARKLTGLSARLIERKGILPSNGLSRPVSWALHIPAGFCAKIRGKYVTGLAATGGEGWRR